MHTATRASIAFTVLGLAAYVSGLQKKALSPIANWLADLPAGVQMVGIAVVLLGVASVSAWRSRSRRATLRAAERDVAGRVIAPRSVEPAPSGMRRPGLVSPVVPPSALPSRAGRTDIPSLVFTPPPPPPRFR